MRIVSPTMSRAASPLRVSAIAKCSSRSWTGSNSDMKRSCFNADELISADSKCDHEGKCGCSVKGYTGKGPRVQGFTAPRGERDVKDRWGVDCRGVWEY